MQWKVLRAKMWKLALSRTPDSPWGGQFCIALIVVFLAAALMQHFVWLIVKYVRLGRSSIAKLYSSTLVGGRAMSQQRIVASRCSASSSASAAAVPCIHRPFEDPPTSSSRRSGPAAAFPDSTAALLHRPVGRGKAPTTDVAGGLMDSLQVPAVDWSNTPAASSAATSSAGGGFCADGVDSSSSDSELQYSKESCIQNSSADDYSKKRMINILILLLFSNIHFKT